MNPAASNLPAPRTLVRAGRASLGVGGLGAVLLIASAQLGGQPWAPSYLAAWLFVLGVALGGMALSIVHQLTGGGWGEAARPVLDASLRTFPVVLVLAAPLALRLPELFAWMRPGDAAVQGRDWYLSVPFFTVRALACFVIWLALARLLRNGAPGGPDPSARATPAIGFVLYALTSTFAAVDWIMSLTPEWRSSVFGLLIGVGQVMSALALAIIVAAALAQGTDETLRGRFHDLGKLMFALVMVWAYLAFMQYLIIWFEDLPEEIGWYLVRTRTSWSALGLLLAATHFVLPFLILLSREVKRRPPLLAAAAGLVLLGCLADTAWLVLPTLRPRGLDFRWGDLFALLAVAGLWFGGLLRAIRAPAATPARGEPQEGIGRHAGQHA